MVSITRSPKSIHDPDGYIVEQGCKLFRIITKDYEPHFSMLVNSGLYARLRADRMIIHHDYKNNKPVILEPEIVPFISYPYEWSFSMLKEAALLTLDIQKLALEYGMTLKDSPADNIQFIHGKPALIDVTSFVILDESKPWQAYRQFCEEFLAPLALASYVSIEALEWFKAYPRGVPLRLASRLIPKRRFVSELGLHLYLHSNFKSKKLPKKSHMNRHRLVGIIDSLRRTVSRLPIPREATLWSNYYEGSSNYSKIATRFKEQAVKEALEIAKPDRVLDLGCNEGYYTAKIAREVKEVIALDSDYRAIDSLYNVRSRNILPLVVNICNPSPDSGWLNKQRDSLLTRIKEYKPNMIGALALIHHLCLESSLSLEAIAGFLRGLGEWLLVEFVPEYDSQVEGITATIDKHHPYNEEVFIKAFNPFYRIEKTYRIQDSVRTLYLMRRLND